MNETEKARGYARMKRIATGLLGAMAAVYAAASAYEPAYPVLGFVRAFAEAAMVGAIADWFAVTAIFRHPLGLPLPHTAIIPKNKDRIGENLGKFVERNFLSAENLAAKIEDIDFTAAFAEWLNEPARSRGIASRVTAFVPELLATIDDEAMQRFVRENLTERMRRIDTAPLVGKLVDALVDSGRYEQVVTAVLQQLALLFHENKDNIRHRVRENTAWLWQQLSIDEKVSDNVISVVDGILTELSENPRHASRQRFYQAMEAFVEELKTSPAYLARWEALKEELLAHPAVARYLSDLWSEIKQGIQSDAASADSTIRARLETLIAGTSETLLREDAVRERLNAWLREAMLDVIRARGHEIARLIADTVRQWDTATVTEKIELEVGKDLQFIRINGTLIGGMVGLVLHALTWVRV